MMIKLGGRGAKSHLHQLNPAEQSATWVRQPSPVRIIDCSPVMGHSEAINLEPKADTL
jgi:hypothetical protein